MSPKLIVTVKVGGSSLDAEVDPAERHQRYIGSLMSALEILAKKYSIVAVPGGGPPNDYREALLDKYGPMYSLTESDEMSAATLRMNARNLEIISNRKAELIEPEQYLTAAKVFENGHIVLMYHAPDHVVIKHKLMASTSDSHTLAIADLHRCRNVVFVKRTDGLYLTDPRKGVESDREFHERTKNNRKIPVVKASDLLVGWTAQGEKISRIGSDDGRDEHVIENSAIEYLISEARYVERIVITTISRPELLERAFEGEPNEEYSVITKS